MRLTQYIYGYLIYVAAIFASFFISDAFGWGFFELGVAATLILNAIFGIVPFAIGLGCLFIASHFFKPIDVTLPRTHFFFLVASIWFCFWTVICNISATHQWRELDYLHSKWTVCPYCFSSRASVGDIRRLKGNQDLNPDLLT
jgi:hypothetical protein